MNEYRYTTTAHWTAERDGLTTAESVPEQIQFSAPPEFKGRAGVWTPEHFLVASVASCFMVTFVGIAAISKFEFPSIDVSVTGLLEKTETGLRFTRMTVRPTLELAREADRERAMRLLEKTEHSCLILRSLNAEATLEPEILFPDTLRAA